MEPPGWPEQEQARQRRPPCCPACRALAPSLAFPRGNQAAGMDCPASKGWRGKGVKDGGAERVSRVEAPGWVTGQELSYAGGLRVCIPPPGVQRPQDLRRLSLLPSPPSFPTSRAAPGLLLSQGLLPESGRLVVCCPGRLLALNAILGCPPEGRQGLLDPLTLELGL